MNRSLLVTALLCSSVVAAHAGGPRVLLSGQALKWNLASAINYRVDKGALGQIADPQKMAADAFGAWTQALPSLQIKQSTMAENVTSVVRYKQLANTPIEGNIVVFDDSGQIIEDLYGAGASSLIIGQTNPFRSNTELVRFVGLFNGAKGGDRAKMSYMMVHEFGHALGLDHSQVNADAARNGNAADDAGLPTMYPTSSDDNAQLAKLNPDDVSALLALYSAAGSPSGYAILKGRVMRGGAIVRGANVLATAVSQGANGFVDDRVNRFSCVSDFLMNQDGAFVIAVPPGRYRLQVEPILKAFFGPSSVGPYAAKATDISFVSPVTPTRMPGTVTVAAGQLLDLGVVAVQ